MNCSSSVPSAAAFGEPCRVVELRPPRAFDGPLGHPIKRRDEIENLRERLAAIEGFDPALALRNLHGQHAMLLRVLRRFATTYRHGLPVLLEASGREHELIARWRLVCHSVRGALAAIGARALSAQVLQLEGELRTLGSRASLIANARRVHEAVIELAQRLTIELAATAAPSSAPEPMPIAMPAGRDDPARLSLLRRLLILDSAPEPAFDAITARLAASLDARIALVNLLDDDRDWFKARVGFAERESPAAGSFCEAFFNTDEQVIVVEDTLADQAYMRHPFVTGAPWVRFYAAARLRVGGFTVGTLCAYDSRRRQCTLKDIGTLRALAAEVETLLIERAPPGSRVGT